MNKLAVGLIAGLAGLIAGGLGVSMLGGGHGDEAPSTAGGNEPLYWVAPMDPSYRRDAPGKSPMGMDLVPVYEDRGNGGEVRISPLVENNLGVRTAQVEMGALHTAVRTVGYVRFDEDRLLHVHPRVEGWIEELNVKTEGEFIKEGQPVYSIYSPALMNAQEELALAMERGNDRLIQSAEERLRALQVPQRQIDQVKAERTVRPTVTVYAPRDGVLAELGIREGHFVQPGSALMSIGVLDAVWVIAEVFERQASLVSEGDRVTMTLDYLPGREWQGTVDFIYPTLDEETRTVPVRLRFQNADHALKPNMFAQVTIHSRQDDPVLLAPNEAVIRSGTQDRAVLALGEGRYKSVEVVIGRRGDAHTEILAGLEAGDIVVTSAQFLLDSESSISSDFKRMDAVSRGGPMEAGAGHDETMTDALMAEDENGMDHAGMEMDETSAMAMEGGDGAGMDAGAAETAMGGDSVWTRGVIERIMGAGILSVTHDPVPAWEWPAMTMMFEVADGVDISEVEEGDAMEIEITRQDGGQLITGIRPLD